MRYALYSWRAGAYLCTRYLTIFPSGRFIYTIDKRLSDNWVEDKLRSMPRLKSYQELLDWMHAAPKIVTKA